MFRRASTIVVVLLISVQAAAALPFRNGSFEQSSIPNLGIGWTLGPGSTAIDGWTVDGTGIDYVGTLWQAADGGRSLDLLANTAGGAIYQDFDTVEGSLYGFWFARAANPDGGSTARWVRARLTDVLTGNSVFGLSAGFPLHPEATRSDMHWQYFFYSFRAKGSMTRLRFEDSSPAGTMFYGAAIDDVTIAELPEPSSLILIGSGLAAVLARRRLKTRIAG